MSEPKYVRFFEEVGIDDVPLVGGKNASLGEMYRELGSDGVRVPNGFATTSEGYNHMLEEADAWKDLHAALDDLDSTNVTDLGRRGQRAREIVYGAGLPEDLAREIIAGYRRLQEEYGDDVSLAVRSSATAEDLPTASFAGQQETYLNVHGDGALLEGLPSLLLEPVHRPRDPLPGRARVRPLQAGAVDRHHEDGPVRPRGFGVFFSLDTESGFRDVVFITGAYGLGENVVQGAVDPDEFYVHKPTFSEETGQSCAACWATRR